METSERGSHRGQRENNTEGTEKDRTLFSVISVVRSLCPLFETKLKRVAQLFVFLGLIPSWCLPQSIPPPPFPNYELTFAQDFSTMKSLADLKVYTTPLAGSYYLSVGNRQGTWIAHKPDRGDWFTFIDPIDNYNPFGIGDGHLTIRVAKRGYGDPKNEFGGYSGGILSSMDSAGNGFAQRYGYFEASMWCSGDRNTWPGFWLLSSPGLLNRALDTAELDIVEEYGNWGPADHPDPEWLQATWHVWGANNEHQADGKAVREDTLTKGYHQFGVDVEPDTSTWYYDRQKFWQAPTLEAAKSPMFVMINLALGGGTFNNAAVTAYDWSLTPNPTDLKVQYVAVWASPATPRAK